MCGINGFTWRDDPLIRKMNYIARFRGPDGNGIYSDDQVSLGSTRLAIIDLNERANQPLKNEDGTVWIVFNGEIYNYLDLRAELINAGHHFTTNSDTEVIIHAYEEYGLKCFDLFNGMWGLAIYDMNKQLLVLSRDRFGIKPLYYHDTGTSLVFSSMLGAFAEHEIKFQPNERAIMEYLAYNLVQHSAQTFFAGIYSVLPGHALVYDLASRQHTAHKWFNPQAAPKKDVNSLKQAFRQAVRWRTVADVPVGVCLSGGIDSTAITCILRDQLPGEFNTFSLVAPGSPLDETPYINEVVRLTNASSFSTEVAPETFLEDVEDFVAAMEEPVTGLSAYAQYRVFKLANAHGSKVLLDGQGGDELFAGYLYYWSYFFYELFSKRQFGALLINMWQVLRKYKQAYPFSLFFFLLLPDSLRIKLWSKRVTPWVNHDYLQRVCNDERDPRWQPMAVRPLLDLTLNSTSIPHNLMWGDKSSMRWSVECREPFMDPDVVASALALDSADLLMDGETKRFFREAIKDSLPALIYNRKDKIGFAAPEEEFFRHPRVIAFAKDLIHSERFKHRPYWNWPVVARIFADHKAGRRDAGELIWKWLNLELWLREYFSEDGRRAPVRGSLASVSESVGVPAT